MPVSAVMHERVMVRLAVRRLGKIGALGKVWCIRAPRIFPGARILPEKPARIVPVGELSC